MKRPVDDDIAVSNIECSYRVEDNAGASISLQKDAPALKLWQKDPIKYGTSNNDWSIKCPGAKDLSPCAPGFVCDTPESIRPCPEDHYCPAGTYEPKPCAFGWLLCPREGLAKPEGASPVAFAFVVGCFVLCQLVKAAYALEQEFAHMRLITQCRAMEESVLIGVNKFAENDPAMKFAVPEAFFEHNSHIVPPKEPKWLGLKFRQLKLTYMFAIGMWLLHFVIMFILLGILWGSDDEDFKHGRRLQGGGGGSGGGGGGPSSSSDGGGPGDEKDKDGGKMNGHHFYNAVQAFIWLTCFSFLVAVIARFGVHLLLPSMKQYQDDLEKNFKVVLWYNKATQKVEKKYVVREQTDDAVEATDVAVQEKAHPWSKIRASIMVNTVTRQVGKLKKKTTNMVEPLHTLTPKKPGLKTKYIPPGEKADENGEFLTRDMRIDFEFKELGLALHGSGFKVLAGVTGALPAGAVTAVMGPSGAGKTTFLNTGKIKMP